MGSSSRIGSIVVGETPHPEFTVSGEGFRVEETIWNGVEGHVSPRSFDLVRCSDGQILTDCSWDSYPSDGQIIETLNSHGFNIIELPKGDA